MLTRFSSPEGLAERDRTRGAQEADEAARHSSALVLILFGFESQQRIAAAPLAAGGSRAASKERVQS
jgi:hypothetical protein